MWLIPTQLSYMLYDDKQNLELLEMVFWKYTVIFSSKNLKMLYA